MTRQEEMASLQAATRGFYVSQEYDRLLQVRQEAPDVFARIPQHYQDRALSYAERKRDWDRLQLLEAREREEIRASW